MKPSASSDCRSGGSTATMSSTTTSLIACPDPSMSLHYCFEHGFFRKTGPHFALTRPFGSGPCSMQPRRLQQLGAVGRAQRHVEGDALVMDGERHIDAGSAKRPEFSIKLALAGNLVAVDAEDHVAGLELGACGGSPARHADDDDAVVDLGGVHAKPRARRLVD